MQRLIKKYANRSQLNEQMQNILQTPVDLAKDLTRQNLEWIDTLQQTFLEAIKPPGKHKEENSED